MLRNVLDDYLSSVAEREFYYPFTALLHAMDFFDIHVTDGGSEFGKDFIAKRVEDGTTYQYAIQAKRGDINQPTFRNKVMGQLLEAVILRKISHPQLDPSIPQRTVLMTTGELVDNAFLALNELNRSIEENYGKQGVEFWGKNRLIEFSERYGLTGVHRNTARGIAGFAQFYLIYGKALEGILSDREIEEYSRVWLDDTLARNKRILRASLEAEIIAAKLVENGQFYEAIAIHCALARVILEGTYDAQVRDLEPILGELVEEIILPLCRRFVAKFQEDWDLSGTSLVHLCLKSSPFPFISYLVWCSRICEIISLNFFICDDQVERRVLAAFLKRFIKSENGAGHAPSDRYTVSIVWSCLALEAAGFREDAVELIKKSTLWLCDRVESGFGIARFDASEIEETRCLIGFPFDAVEVERNRSSFLATALADLAAFLQERDLYADIVNDLEACKIVFNYWQFPDVKGSLSIESESCVTYPNIPHMAELPLTDDPVTYAEHMRHEPDAYRIVSEAGSFSVVLMSVLLRDRYFPKVWSVLAPPQSQYTRVEIEY